MAPEPAPAAVLDLVDQPKLGPPAIARALGKALSTFYAYWPTQDDLVNAAIDVTPPHRKKRQYVWPRDVILRHLERRRVSASIPDVAWLTNARQLLEDLDLVPEGARKVCLQRLIRLAMGKDLR